mmetsp:Transcript_5338/g.12887  ORF Transcript_5338/g.12887 Transcript_5338/m.12887 type:complete len:200 (+) Transcript_5338:144-743(+)
MSQSGSSKTLNTSTRPSKKGFFKSLLASSVRKNSQNFAIRASSLLDDVNIDVDYALAGTSKKFSKGDCAKSKDAEDYDPYTGCMVAPARRQVPDQTEFQKDAQMKDRLSSQERLNKEAELQRQADMELLASLAKAADAERLRLAKERSLRAQADVERLVISVRDAQQAGFIQLVRRESTDVVNLPGNLCLSFANVQDRE